MPFGLGISALPPVQFGQVVQGQANLFMIGTELLFCDLEVLSGDRDCLGIFALAKERLDALV